jgi:hypothetical protein
MLWASGKIYLEEPFEREADLEEAILQVAPALFGQTRIYLDAKRKIGRHGKIRNIPDGYLLDLSSTRDPKLYVVENELANHDPLRHIAVQILEFSLSFESSPNLVKKIVKDALTAEPEALERCRSYTQRNGFENVDVLLEQMIFGQDRFNALVIIDSLDPELDTVLISRFKFPVEVLELDRYLEPDGQRVFRFKPFLADVQVKGSVPATTDAVQSTLDPSDVDTVVVPARDDGFNEVFIGENRWYKIRMHSSMIPKIKYAAAYRVAPVSAVTHIAPVASIEQWPDTNKYAINFAEPAAPIGPIRLVPNGKIKALQASRYTSKQRLDQAKTLDEAF